MKILPVVLSGGAGTRLWPVSRRAYPKPFMKMADGESLAQKTIKRAMGVATDQIIMTVTGRDYFFLTRDEYANVGATSDFSLPFLLEPMARNTAPAAALAALYAIQLLGEDVIILLLPADHLINEEAQFQNAVKAAGGLAERGKLVTFGVTPTHAETGYGYIKKGSPIDLLGHQVASFREKPDAATAREYYESGEYYWNSGMFCMRAQALLDAMSEHAPEVLQATQVCWTASDSAQQPVELEPDSFSAHPAISIDYAIMEQAENAAVVGGDFGWSDIGSWNAMSELSASDEFGNRTSGQALLVDSRNCFLQAEKRLVAAVGVDDLVVVDTADAVLITHKTRAQDVKEVVDRLQADDHEATTFHQTVHRPWGSYTVLEDEDDCKVKRLVVKPGQVLSLQLHHRRSEHWTVVQGTATVRIGDETKSVKQNESVYIPVKTLHRLENKTDTDIALIEVQVGDYFGEDDIERFEDVYGRV